MELREAFKKQENTLALCQLIVSAANPQVFILDFYKYLLDVMNHFVITIYMYLDKAICSCIIKKALF